MLKIEINICQMKNAERNKQYMRNYFYKSKNF